MVEEESGVRRWLVDITRWRPSPAQFHAAAALLPPHDRAAITRFVKEDDRKRALVSRLLQYSLLHHVLRIPFQRIDICRTIEGKPYLQNKNVTFPNFNFNTSHQGDYVGIASEPLCLVGLDIVSISKPQGETATEFINNFSSYLTDHEWNCIIRAGTPDEVLTEFYRYNIQGFLDRPCVHSESAFQLWYVAPGVLEVKPFMGIFERYWCLKEAFVKAIGAGVGFGLHRLEFHHVNWSNIYIRIDGEESKKWRFSLFKLDGMHLASIAKGHPEDAVNSYKKTLPNVIMEKEPLRALLEAPEEPFTLWTVEQLTELQD